MHRIRDSLKESGFTEILPLSLVGEALLTKAGMDAAKAVALQNPLGEETRLLHTSTLPGLLEHAQRNLLEAGKELKTFSASHVFRKTGEEWPELGLLYADLDGSGDGDLKRDPFLLLKQDLECTLQSVGLTAAWKKQEDPPSAAHPGRAARIIINNDDVGYLSEVHPDVRAAFGLSHRAAVAALDLSKVLVRTTAPAVPEPLSAFPAVTYDVTVPRTQEQHTEELLAKLHNASPLLERVEIVDLYGSGHAFNLTLRFTYRAKDRTLTEEEAMKEQDRVVKVMGSA